MTVATRFPGTLLPGDDDDLRGTSSINGLWGPRESGRVLVGLAAGSTSGTRPLVRRTV